jgi:hypothetical protein
MVDRKRPAAAHRQLVTSVVSFQVRECPVTDIRFAFEMLQHDHEAKIFRFATEGSSLTRQEFAEECDNNVLMAYGRCLRPALYSSLRSSPSHPTGVSALRVTIAIANARKQWGLASQLPSRGGSFARIGHQPTRWGRRYWRIHRNDPNCILSQIAASTESLLAWKLGPGNQRPEVDQRIAREKRRLRFGACS